jgi:hypothetical protein
MHPKLQIQNLEVLKAKATRPKKSTKGDLKLDQAPISQYLWHPKSLISKVDVGSRLVVMAPSMNRLQPPMKDLSTCQIT